MAEIELNRAAVGRLLKSPEIQRELLKRAERMADQAGPGFVADVQVGRTRARAMVKSTDYESMKAEATDRSLTRAIDAGRG